jgi:PAS domain S-box-containing protein
MSEKPRSTGIPVIGDIPWGTHFCHFYRTSQDLLEILVPYFSKGLENNELCVWVTSEPLGVEAARAALDAALPDLGEYVRRGQIEIVPHSASYLENGTFDVGRVLEGFERKLDGALAAGFEGLRVAGDGSRLETKDWRAFTDYEAAVDRVVASSRALAACAYSLDRCGFDEILDIIRNHRFALVRREGRWELIESGERKRLEEELRKRTVELESLFNNSNAGLALFDAKPPYTVLAHNRSYQELYPEPYRSTGMVGKNIFDYAPSAEARGVVAVFDEVVRTKEAVNLLDFPYDSRPPEKSWFNWHLSPVRHDGEVVALASMSINVTRQHLADEALRQSREELEAKVKERTADLERSNVRLKEEIDKKTRTEESLRLEEARLDALLRLSQMGEAPLNEITGFTLEEAIRLTHSKIGFVGFLNADESVYTLHSVSKDVVKECAVTGDPLQWHVVGAGIWADATRAHRTLFVNDYSQPHPRKKGLPAGHPAIERFMVVPILESGRIVALAGVGNKAADYDASDERQVSLLLSGMWSCVERRQAIRLAAAVEQASEAVVMLDLDGTVRYVNAAFETINKIPRGKVVGNSYFGYLGDGPLAAAIREAVAGGRTWHGELSRPVVEGRPIELEVTVSPATDSLGKVIGGLVTEKDVTHENALQRLVRQSQKMEALGTLAGGITHDFNNILGTIVVNTELALLDLEPSHAARVPLPTVLQAANRGKELVKQIITFSRQREWERKPLEAAPIVKEGMRLLRSTLPKDLVIHETISPESGSILGDPSQVHQVLVNLCQNAALAMREKGGHLEIKLEPVEVDAGMVVRHPDLRPGPHVRLTVADTGCGMSPAVMERIFEPFFTTRGPGEGSGLGLAVVHGIVKSYNGTITVYSEPGKGSVFSVYLPRLEGPATAAQAAVAAQPTRGRERILLVEDEPAQRRSLARSLQKLGYRVTSRGEGRSALAAFRKAPDSFDVIVTDQTMPRMSGLELAAAVAELRPEVPVVLCTGFSEKVNWRSDGGRHGAVREFVMKPFTLDEISRVIRKALGEDGGGKGR